MLRSAIQVFEVREEDVAEMLKLPRWMVRGFAELGSLAAKAVLAMREAGRGN